MTMLAIGLLTAGTVHAQSGLNLNFKRIVNLRPTVELYFAVSCNGQPAWFTDKSYFRVTENGRPVQDFTLWCPDETGHCGISVCLAIDHSGSMSGAGLSGMQAAANAFVDMLDGVVDEAGIIIFDNNVLAIVDPMTPDKTVLHNAINGIKPGGATALWDAGYQAVQQTLTGSNSCRAVILATDGGDNSSTHAWDDMVKLAQRNRIHIFTVGIGSSVDATYLAAIADQTGGRFYLAASPSMLTEIYREISTIIFQGFGECIITYNTLCQDGGTRNVDLSLVNFCNGSDRKTLSYKAVRDTTTFASFTTTLGSGAGRGGSLVHLPITSADLQPGAQLHPMRFDIVIDTGVGRIDAVSTQGTLLNSDRVTITPIADGWRVETLDTVLVSGAGQLFDVVVHTANPAGTDTVWTPVTLRNWVFTAGCVKVSLANPGRLGVIPRAPSVTCTLTAPAALVWDKARREYSPAPLSLFMSLHNLGDADVQNARLMLNYSGGLTLVSPTGNVQPATPATIQPQNYAQGEWKAIADRRTHGDSIVVTITGMFDNHPDVMCSRSIWIPASDAVLSCSVTAPEIALDATGGGYIPMPFDVSVLAANSGEIATDTVWAWIAPLQGRIQLVDTAVVQGRKQLFPPVLGTGAAGSCTFRLSHPFVEQDSVCRVRVAVFSANADTSWCETIVRIPGLYRQYVIVRGATTICLGDSVRLSAGGVYRTRLWSTGDTAETITVRTSGTYSFSGRDVQGSTYVSPPVTIIVHDATPQVVRMGMTLTSSPAITYQWAMNGVDIPGATNRSLAITVSGIYTVSVVDSMGCRGKSVDVNIVVDVAPVPVVAAALAVSVHPEPSAGAVTVHVARRAAGALEITVHDLLGRRCLVRHLDTAPATTDAALDLTTLPRGIYLCRVASGAEVRTVRVTKW